MRSRPTPPITVKSPPTNTAVPPGESERTMPPAPGFHAVAAPVPAPRAATPARARPGAGIDRRHARAVLPRDGGEEAAHVDRAARDGQRTDASIGIGIPAGGGPGDGIDGAHEVAGLATDAHEVSTHVESGAAQGQR